MKKLMVILGVVLFASFFFTSCGGKKAADIKVEELKEACDFTDAMLVVIKEMKDLKDANKDAKNLEDLSKEDKEAYDALEEKMNEIAEAIMKKKIDFAEMEKCDSYKEIEKIDEEMEKE